MTASGRRPLTGHRHAEPASPHTKGITVDRGLLYDLEEWCSDTFLNHGQTRNLRQRVLGLARLRDGESLLDVGSGTGTLALLAAAQLGPGGRVAGIDLAPGPVARARRKARRVAATTDFRVGSIDDIPFPDASFDAVTSTMMLHHLPEDVTVAGLAEVTRVLRPGGRFVVADFTDAPSTPHGRHQMYAGLDEATELISRAGLVDITMEPLPFRRAHHGFGGAAVALATKPSP